MNKNSKNRRKLVQKWKEDANFDIPMTIEGTKLGSRKQMIYCKSQPRKSDKNKQKVAAAGCKNPQGPNIRTQMEQYYGSLLKVC